MAHQNDTLMTGYSSKKDFSSNKNYRAVYQRYKYPDIIVGMSISTPRKIFFKRISKESKKSNMKSSFPKSSVSHGEKSIPRRYYKKNKVLNNIPFNQKAKLKNSINSRRNRIKRKLPQILSIGNKRESSQYDTISFVQSLADVAETKTAELVIVKDNTLTDSAILGSKIIKPGGTAAEGKVVQTSHGYAMIKNTPKTMMTKYNNQFYNNDEPVPKKKK